MKMEYIKPEIDVVEVELVHMIANSINVDDEEKPGGWFDQTNKRRGDWGDLWSEDEE